MDSYFTSLVKRLTVEFEKRDKAILDLKKGMDTLVQSLRANGNNNGGDQVK